MIINPGKIIPVTFDGDTHTYVSAESGKVIPSVTQIMRPLTDAAYGSIPKDVLSRAAEFGTAVHACTEFLDAGDLDWTSVSPEWIPYVNAYRKFKEGIGIRPNNILYIERRIASERYAGTIDRVFAVLDEIWIVDIKTTSVIHPHVGVQLAAYEALYLKSTGETDKKIRRFALQLCEDASYRLKEFKGTADESCFTYLLGVHTWMKNHDLVKNH